MTGASNPIVAEIGSAPYPDVTMRAQASDESRLKQGDDGGGGAIVDYFPRRCYAPRQIALRSPIVAPGPSGARSNTKQTQNLQDSSLLEAVRMQPMLDPDRPRRHDQGDGDRPAAAIARGGA
jgi:hypothetical protein